MEGVDFNLFSGKMASEAIDLDFGNSFLQVHRLNVTTHRWEAESVDLKARCQGNSTLDTNLNLTTTNGGAGSKRKSCEKDKKDASGEENILNSNISQGSAASKTKLRSGVLSAKLDECEFIEKSGTSKQISATEKKTEIEVKAVKEKKEQTKETEEEKMIEKTDKKKINDKGKNILDHLTDLHRFRI